MERIIADVERIKDSSKQMMLYINEFDNKIKNFDSLIEEINEIWKGEDSLKFVNAMYNATDRNLRKISNLLKIYAKYLNDVVNVYEIIDNDYSEKKIEISKEGVNVE